MIFLYRFEVLALDGLAANTLPPSQYLESRQALYRELHLLTNYEVALPFPVEPYASGFLPIASAGSQSWTFTPEAIEHDGVRLDGEKASGQLKVSLPLAHPLAQLYVLDQPGYQVWLTLAQYDPALSATPLVIWVGQVASAEFDESRCSLTLQHLEKLLSRQGLTARHPRSCPHVLFDSGTCRVKQHAYDNATAYWKWREDGFVATVSADGKTLTVPEAANRPDGFFNDGFVHIGAHYSSQLALPQPDFVPRALIGTRTINPALPLRVDGGHRRSIVSQVGATLTLQIPLPPGEYAGATVTLYAGCDGSATACETRFNNTASFGGYPYIPIKNPFETGLIAARA